MLTGDELILNGPEYCTQLKDGTAFVLGKLLVRTKFYSPFHEAFSTFNNVFIFENKPDRERMEYLDDMWHNTAMFFLVDKAERHKAERHKAERHKGKDLVEERDEEQGFAKEVKPMSDDETKRKKWWDCFWEAVVA